MSEKLEQYNKSWNGVYYRLVFIKHLRENINRILREDSDLSSYGSVMVVAGSIEAIALNIRLITEGMVTSTYRYIDDESPRAPKMSKAIKKLQELGIGWTARDVRGREKTGEGEWHIPRARNEGLSMEDIASGYTQMLSGILHVPPGQIGHDYKKYLDRCDEIESKLRILLSGSTLYEGDNAILMWYWEDGKGHTFPLTNRPEGLEQ